MLTLIKNIFFPFWRQRHLLGIHLKGGTIKKLWVYNSTITTDSNSGIMTKYSITPCSTHLGNPIIYLDIRAVECIGVIKTRGFIQYKP